MYVNLKIRPKFLLSVPEQLDKGCTGMDDDSGLFCSHKKKRTSHLFSWPSSSVYFQAQATFASLKMKKKRAYSAEQNRNRIALNQDNYHIFLFEN